MADPISIGTLAAVGMGATAAGGAVKMFGNLFEGAGKAAADTYRSQLAMTNAKLAFQDAQYARASGYVEEQQIDYKTADVIAHTKVGFAAGNINTKTGSAAQVVDSERAIGVQNKAITAANAAKRAYGFEVASAKDMADATMYQQAAKYDRTASYISAASTVLGTAGDLASKGIGGSKAGSGVFQS